MESMTLYDFVTDTYEKLVSSNGSTTTSSCIPYLEQHPKFGVYGHVIRRKGHNTIAYFKNGSVPDAKDATKSEWYAATEMAIFSPTRDLATIKASAGTWVEALMSYRANCQRSDILFWIDNCQYRHDAEAAARRKRASEKESSGEMPDETCSDTDECDEGCFTNQDDLRDSSTTRTYVEFTPNVNTQLFAAAGMLAGTQAGIFPSNNNAQWDVIAEPPHRSNAADEDQLSVWKQAMTNDAHFQVEFGMDEEIDGSRVLGTLLDESPGVQYVVSAEHEDANDPPLLPDQQRAFDIVREQVFKQSTNNTEVPIKLLVLGEGGTGKSELINQLRHLLQKEVTLSDGSTKVVSTVSISAFTGIAASHIGGSTIHKEWSIQVRQNQKMGVSLKVQQDLVEKNKWRNWIIIDEISMTSSAFLLKVARQADIAKAGTYDTHGGMSFGNMNVILSGDFYQFPPVTGKPLYDASERLNEDERLGQALFEQFDKVVILHDQVHSRF